MTDRKEATGVLSKLTEKYLSPNGDPRIYWAKEVTFDYSTDHRVRVDYMMFKPVNNSVSGIEHGDFYCYEIKSSVEDFRSKNGHNMIGDYNYYVMPAGVFDVVKNEIPWNVGVLVPEIFTQKRWRPPLLMEEVYQSEAHLQSVKNAHRANREKPISEMLLMMFRSCARNVRKETVVDTERKNGDATSSEDADIASLI